MKKSAKTAEQSDVELIALLVARQLRQQHAIDTPPKLSDYRVDTVQRACGPCPELHIAVELGRGFRAEVIENLAHDDDDLELLLRSAEDISETIADLMNEAPAIRAMVSEVRAVTRREIAKANRRGLPYALTSLTLMPVTAGVRDDYCVRVEHIALGCSLQPETFAFEAQCADDAIHAFAGVREQQEARVASRTELDLAGATGAIDAVVSAALDQAEFDFPELLAKLRNQDVIDLKAADGRTFCLYWKDGTIFSHLALADGIRWNEGKITFDKAPISLNNFSTGSPLRDLYDHPLLDQNLVACSMHGTAGERSSIYCNPSRLAFDAGSGRRWML